MIHQIMNKKDGKTYKVIGYNIVGNKKSDNVKIQTNKGIETIKLTDVNWMIIDPDDIYKVINNSKPKTSRKSPVQDKTAEFKKRLATAEEKDEK